MAFAAGFTVFLVLMAVLVFFVLRFAVREGRRRRSVGEGPPLGHGGEAPRPGAGRPRSESDPESG
jgi:hypothetical protein